MWQFNTVDYTVGGLPPYIFFAGTGIMFALALYPILLLKSTSRVNVYMPCLLLALPSILVGSKLLGILVSIGNAIQHGEQINKETFLQSGIVYYGGLLAVIASFELICKKREKVYNRTARDALAVVIPLFHVWGRIGCFSSGCCYGIEVKSPISVVYTISKHNGLFTNERIPVQLIEAAIEFLIFLLLLGMYLKGNSSKKLLHIYLLLYALVRFWLEFLRGDIVRGEYGGITTSQWISIGIVLYICMNTIFRKENKNYG